MAVRGGGGGDRDAPAGGRRLPRRLRGVGTAVGRLRSGGCKTVGGPLGGGPKPFGGGMSDHPKATERNCRDQPPVFSGDPPTVPQTLWPWVCVAGLPGPLPVSPAGARGTEGGGVPRSGAGPVADAPGAPGTASGHIPLQATLHSCHKNRPNAHIEAASAPRAPSGGRTPSHHHHPPFHTVPLCPSHSRRGGPVALTAATRARTASSAPPCARGSPAATVAYAERSHPSTQRH